MGGTMDSRKRASDRPYFGLICAVLGIAGAVLALQVGTQWNQSLSPGGVFALAACILTLIFGGRLASNTARWQGVVLLANGYIMLLLGAWVVIRPSMAELPNRTALFAFVSAGLLLAVGLTTVLRGRGSRETVTAPEAAAGAAPGGVSAPAPDDAVADVRGEPATAVLGVVGGLLGILGAIAAMTSHGPALGGPAFVLALAGIFGGVLAEGNRTLAYVLLVAPGVLGLAFGWLFWVPAGVLLVAAGLLEVRSTAGQRVPSSEAGSQ
jgi:hypothetical protein